jgi:hypothetical protein
VDDGRACGERAATQLASWHKDPFQKSRKNYRAGQVLAISDFEQSPSDGFDELEAEVWYV